MPIPNVEQKILVCVGREKKKPVRLEKNTAYADAEISH